jgi:hypothetical protein
VKQVCLIRDRPFGAVLNLGIFIYTLEKNTRILGAKMKSKRQAARMKRQRQKTITTIIWAGLGIILIAAIGYLAWGSVRPAVGQSVAVMGDTGHVETGTDPGPYNSDPPTSGKHYADEYEAGFYDETSQEAQAPYPEGYLVHNLEHGYVIFWYNCQLVDEQRCQNLKTEIQSVMEQENNFKVIAFPRATLDVPVVMTSWGKIQRFDTFDTRLARDFVRQNRNKAPEPNAP